MHFFYIKCWLDLFKGAIYKLLNFGQNYFVQLGWNWFSVQLPVANAWNYASFFTAFSGNVGAWGMWACSLFLSFFKILDICTCIILCNELLKEILYSETFVIFSLMYLTCGYFLNLLSNCYSDIVCCVYFISSDTLCKSTTNVRIWRGRPWRCVHAVLSS